MGTKRAEQKARTREAVIVAARELFHHHGFDSVTIRQVAKAAGFSTGAIFASFPEGKASMFEAAMGEKAPDVEAFLARIVAVASGGPTITTLTAVDALVELAIEAERLRRHLRGNHA